MRYNVLRHNLYQIHNKTKTKYPMYSNLSTKAISSAIGCEILKLVHSSKGFTFFTLYKINLMNSIYFGHIKYFSNQYYMYL